MSTHALVTNAQPKPRAGRRMTATDEVVFLLDVDNTLLDNDRIVADLDDHLRRACGGASPTRSDADYLGALQRYRLARIVQVVERAGVQPWRLGADGQLVG